MTQVNDDEAIREYALVGAAILDAQRIELLLYGIISHWSPQARSKRFKELDPEKFLRGNVEDLKATLGQLVKEFEDKKFLTTEDLHEFVNDRNLIAHNYYRLVKADIKGGKRLENPEKFLIEFAEKCNHWQKVLLGLIATMKKEMAMQAEQEVTLTEKERTNIEHYKWNNAENYLINKITRDGSDAAE